MSDSTAFLLSDVARLLRRRFDGRASASGVTRQQWRVLTTLSRNEGANQITLAEMLEVEAITLCRMIDRLEEAQLVERRRDPADRRAWQLFLTERAWPLITRLRSIADDLMAEALADLAPGESERLDRSLQMIRTRLAAPAIEQAVANG